MSPQTYRDLTSAVALIAVLLMATAARAEDNRDVNDVLAILDSLETESQGATGGNRLGDEIERATARLRPKRVREPSTGSTRGQSHQNSSLGIGALGEPMREPTGLPTIYASREGANRAISPLKGDARRRAEIVLARASAQVSACYGDPMLGTDVAVDSLIVQVIIDAGGTVQSTNLVRSPQLATSDIEPCIHKMLRTLPFPENLTNDVAAVTYRWRFELNGRSRLDFTAPNAPAAG